LAIERVAEHFLVPKHEIVPEDKVKEVLAKFGSSQDRFPQILFDDPAVIEVGAKKGDIIKITRNSQTAGKTMYYRVVV